MKLIILATIFSQVVGQAFKCGGGGDITSRGSTTVLPITERCGKKYTATCKDVKVFTNGTGTSSGLRSICGDTSRGETPTDIGNMSRDFKVPSEATEVPDKKGFFQCAIGDKTRQAIRVPVAIDGLTLFVERLNSLYILCIKDNIPSFDLKIIRWMFSNSTTLEAEAIYNFDKDPATRYWSEIAAVCPKETIIPVGPSAEFGTSDYFKEIVFTGGATEGFRSNYKSFPDNSPALRDYVLNTQNSVGFLGYSFYNANNASMAALPIEGVLPSQVTLEDFTYRLFARRIYSMYLNTEASLLKTKCFSDFTFTKAGVIQVDATGFLPIPDAEGKVLQALVPGECIQPDETATPTSKPTRAPVCRCLRILKALRFCCRGK